MSDEELGWRWLPDVLEALLLPEDERKKLKRYKEPPPGMDWKTCYLVFEGGRFLYLQRREDVITSLEGDSEIEEDLPELARWLETAKHRDTYEIGDFAVVVFEAPKLFIEVCEDNMPEFVGW
jgi:hypothetical protein